MEDEKDTNLEKKEDETGDKIGEETLANMDIDDSRGEEFERMVNEEYKIWKKETPFLYDLVISRVLEWPSLTVEWLPDQVESPDGEYSVQKIICGTHTLDDEPNYLIIAQVKLPLFEVEYDDSHVNENEHSGRKIEFVQQICHEGEVHRARYMPQNSCVIATKTIDSGVYVFDYGHHPMKPCPDEQFNPDLILKGHESDGFGLSWSKFKQGLLLSGSYDEKICMWDINVTPHDHALDPMQIYKVHNGPVEDVAWSLKHDYLFGSCGDDKYLHIFDLRSPCFTKPIQTLMAHQNFINCLAFNPFNEWILATGSVDNTVKLFDLRKFTSPLHTFNFHLNEVIQVGWSPQNETILASSCAGRRLLVWDLSRIGEEQSSQDAEDGPPELMFIHGGHTDRVVDLSWNPCEDWVIASVADDNILQIWQMADHIYNDEE
ncbi:hypothetical protein Lser_V15G34172 [Lactuca serriola]